MEKELFSQENQQIGQKAEYVNMLKGQIALKVAALEELLFLKAQIEEKYKMMNRELSQQKEKQYCLLNISVNQQCKKAEITNKIEKEAMGAAIAVRQKNRISSKLEQTRTQIQQLRNTCCAQIVKQSRFKQQIQQCKNVESKLKKDNEQFSQKIVDYNECYEEKLHAINKHRELFNYFDQKFKQLEKMKAEVNKELSEEIENQSKLQNQIIEYQQHQQKTKDLLSKQSQQLISINSLLESQQIENQILKQKYLNVKQKLHLLTNKNQQLNQNLSAKRIQQHAQSQKQHLLRNKWQEMRMRVSLKLQYANHFVKELKFF